MILCMRHGFARALSNDLSAAGQYKYLTINCHSSPLPMMCQNQACLIQFVKKIPPFSSQVFQPFFLIWLYFSYFKNDSCKMRNLFVLCPLQLF